MEVLFLVWNNMEVLFMFSCWARAQFMYNSWKYSVNENRSYFAYIQRLVGWSDGKLFICLVCASFTFSTAFFMPSQQRNFENLMDEDGKLGEFFRRILNIYPFHAKLFLVWTLLRLKVFFSLKSKKNSFNGHSPWRDHSVEWWNFYFVESLS